MNAKKSQAFIRWFQKNRRKRIWTLWNNEPFTEAQIKKILKLDRNHP